MTKKQLIRQLAMIPGNPIVLLSSDEEGNSYKEASSDLLYGGCDIGEERPGQKLYEIGILELTSDFKVMGYTKEDIKPTPCVVIYPT